MESSTQSTTEDRSNGSERVSGLAQQLKQDGRERLERGKQAAAQQVEQLADALDGAGSQLNEGQPTIASYATRLADGLDSLAQRLRQSSVEDLLSEARASAVRNPAAYLLGSAALGLVIARFLKSTASDESSPAGMRGRETRAGVESEVSAEDFSAERIQEGSSAQGSTTQRDIH